MKPREYSSLAAFLAHYRLLSASRSNASSLGTDDHELLATMDRALAALSPEERSLIASSDYGAKSLTPAEARRRGRIELKLRRILTAAGLLRP